jgi:hypothetical protein
MNPNDFINVHVYDSQLKNIFIPKKIYSNDEKEILFVNLISKIRNVHAIHAIQTMIIDIHKKNGNNFDKENNIDATDVLADILNSNYEELLPLIEEQLADANQLGLCPIGRVGRLLQIWCCLQK